jgi:hypothetical protein
LIEFPADAESPDPGEGSGLLPRADEWADGYDAALAARKSSASI